MKYTGNVGRPFHRSYTRNKEKGRVFREKKKNEIAKIQAKKELFPFVFPDGILCKKPAYVFSS